MFDVEDIIDIEVDATPDDRSVSKKDELRHSITIQRIINHCLIRMNHPSLSNYVAALKGSLYFDVKGLSFKTMIDKFEAQLVEDLKVFVVKKISEYKKRGGIYYEPKTEDDLTSLDWIDLQRSKHMYYNRKLFYFLENMLATHSALTKARDYVPVGEHE